LGVGVEHIHAHILDLLDRLIGGVQRAGLTITSSLKAAERSTIVSFTTGDAARDEALHASLLAQKVITSLRPHGIRVSPHFYNASEDIDALLQGLRSTAA
jgi:selenocysteine lyase/cysteine desulfurase